MAQARKQCRACDRLTLHERSRPNHVLHLLLTVFTLGLWLPVWMILSLPVGYWRCQTCGNARQLMPATARWAIIIAGPIALLFAALFVAIMAA